MFKGILHFTLKLCFVFFLSIQYSLSAEKNSHNVIIVYKQSSSVHEEAVSQIIKTIKEKNDESINFHYVYTHDSENVDNLKENNTDIIISVGVDAAKLILSLNQNNPVLFTLIPKQSIQTLYSAFNVPVKNQYSSIYLTQPVTRKLNLSRIVLGKPAKIGIALSDQSGITEKELAKKSLDAGMELIAQHLSDYSKPIDAMNAALDDSDIYMSLYDSKLLNRHTAKFLLYMAYKKNKPVIGLSPGYTKAGAVASIFSTPKQIGLQSAEYIIDYLSGAKKYFAASPKYFTVSVNQRVQRNLRLKKLSSNEIEEQLYKMEGGSSDD